MVKASSLLQQATKNWQQALLHLAAGSLPEAKVFLKEASTCCHCVLDERTPRNQPQPPLTPAQRAEVSRLLLRIDLASARRTALSGRGSQALSLASTALERHVQVMQSGNLDADIQFDACIVRAEAHFVLAQTDEKLWRDAVKWTKTAQLILARTKGRRSEDLQPQLAALQKRMQSLQQQMQSDQQRPQSNSGSHAGVHAVQAEPHPVLLTPDSVGRSRPRRDSSREKWRRRMVIALSVAFISSLVTISISVVLAWDSMVVVPEIAEGIAIFVLGWMLYTRRVKRRMLGERVHHLTDCRSQTRRYLGYLYAGWCFADALHWVACAVMTEAFRIRNRRKVVNDNTFEIQLMMDLSICLNAVLIAPYRAIVAAVAVVWGAEPESRALLRSQPSPDTWSSQDSERCLLSTLSGQSLEQCDRFVDEFERRMEHVAFYNDFSEWWTMPNTTAPSKTDETQQTMDNPQAPPRLVENSESSEICPVPLSHGTA